MKNPFGSATDVSNICDMTDYILKIWYNLFFYQKIIKFIVMKIIKINIGGTIFASYESNIRKIPLIDKLLSSEMGIFSLIEIQHILGWF